MEHAPIRKPYAGLPSYYAATANRVTERPQLRGEERCDVAIVGAGFTGMSAALELAERGYSVIVVEGERVGWGASGRNGGQLVNGYSRQPRQIDGVRCFAGRQQLGDFLVLGEGTVYAVHPSLGRQICSVLRLSGIKEEEGGQKKNHRLIHGQWCLGLFVLNVIKIIGFRVIPLSIVDIIIALVISLVTSIIVILIMDKCKFTKKCKCKNINENDILTIKRNTDSVRTLIDLKKPTKRTTNNQKKGQGNNFYNSITLIVRVVRDFQCHQLQ